MKKYIAGVAIAFVLLSLVAWQNRFYFAEDILKELGLQKEEAEEFIGGNFFNSSLQISKTDEIKNMPQARRVAIVKLLGDYIRAYIESPSFAERYKQERDAYMADMSEGETGPSKAEMINQFIRQLKSDESQILQELKSASGAKKTELDEALKQVREAQVALKDEKHPKHKEYFELMKEELMPDKGDTKYDDPADAKAAAEAMGNIDIDEDPFPASKNEFIKKKLKEFIEKSGSVDYNAKTEKRGSKFYFVDEKYEQKDETWKRMYRVGKEVMMPARAYAQAWLASLK